MPGIASGIPIAKLAIFYQSTKYAAPPPPLNSRQQAQKPRRLWADDTQSSMMSNRLRKNYIKNQ